MRVRNELASAKYAGVVLLGGYDVLPSQRLDVLTPQMRAGLDGQVHQDPDRFIVWSDFVYGDRSGDGLADVPVSRIPEPRSSRLVAAALTASASGPLKRFGIRNSARPFADNVWQHVAPPTGSIFVSGSTTAALVQPADVNSPHVYFMLHGSDSDSSRF